MKAQVETVREALNKLDDDGACMCDIEGNTAGYECDWHLSQGGLAALTALHDRLAELERERDEARENVEQFRSSMYAVEEACGKQARRAEVAEARVQELSEGWAQEHEEAGENEWRIAAVDEQEKRFAAEARVQELEAEREEWRIEADRGKWPKEKAQEFFRMQARIAELEEALRECLADLIRWAPAHWRNQGRGETLASNALSSALEGEKS